ncbi:MAG: hypothetical protein Q8Q38_03100 [bacterium]|nr:hypothetical protein [bacterium]MDZ4232056.1 hypothetical protein [Candidatus Pacearchaeota archaeon]
MKISFPTFASVPYLIKVSPPALWQLVFFNTSVYQPGLPLIKRGVNKRSQNIGDAV